MPLPHDVALKIKSVFFGRQGVQHLVNRLWTVFKLCIWVKLDSQVWGADQVTGKALVAN